jgi:hypothetical protein
VTKYLTIDPHIEVMGWACLCFVRNTNAKHTLPILQNHALDDIDAESWYPLQDVLGVFQEIHKRDTTRLFDLVSIGMAIAEFSRIPENHTDSLLIILQYMSKAYPRMHRGGFVGEYLVEPIGDFAIQVIDTTPYPHDFTYGVIYGFARRWKSPKLAVIRRDVASCTDNSCTYVITW